MNDGLVIGLDLGTTTCKAVAIDAAGAVIANESGQVHTLLPRPGWVEQDARELWRVVADTIKRATGRCAGRAIVGVGLSGAMHSLLPVGKDDVPLAPAMTWADDRGAAKLPWLREQPGASDLYQRTGCPLQALYHPARLRWWFEEAPDLASKAARFVALRDWVGFCLTGAWTTDHGLASTTGLLDIRRMAWDERALAIAGVTPERLPALVAPGAPAGKVTAAAAQATGLGKGTPIFGGGSDGGMANLGAAGSGAGRVVLTVGTSGAVRLTTDQPRFSRGGGTWCYVVLGNRWIAGGAINNGGLAAQWVRNQLYHRDVKVLPTRGAIGEVAKQWVRNKLHPDAAGAEEFTTMMVEAEKIAPGAEGLIVLPYFAGERSPHWQPDARAAMVGLGVGHTRAHIARATLEGVAFCLADVWDALELTKEETREVRLTGGIVHGAAWCQILADVLGVEIAACEAADASAMGAAWLAQVGAGLRSVESLEKSPGDHLVSFKPDAGRHEAYRGIRKEFQRLGREVVFNKT